MGQSTKNFTVHGTHLREAYVHAAHRTGLELVLHTGERISGGRVQPVAVAQPRLRRLVRQYLDLVLFRKGFVYNTTTSTTIAATAAHVHCYAAGCWLVPSLVAHLVDLGVKCRIGQHSTMASHCVAPAGIQATPNCDTHTHTPARSFRARGLVSVLQHHHSRETNSRNFPCHSRLVSDKTLYARSLLFVIVSRTPETFVSVTGRGLKVYIPPSDSWE